MTYQSGSASFLFFAVMMALQSAVVPFLCPETKGVSLEKMDARMERA